VYGDGLDEGDFYVNDPNGGAYRCLTYYTDNGWSGRNIVVYKKN